MEEIQVNNIVATASISDKLDLELINEMIPNSEYNKKRFPGLIYRQKMPKTALLIFSSGKVVCTGARTRKEAKIAILNVIDLLSKFQINLNKKPDIHIQNIVATSNLHVKLNLSTIAISLGLENVEYEPEQFPGLVYRVFDPKVVFLIFKSGGIVCTGAKTLEDINTAVKNLKNELFLGGFIKEGGERSKEKNSKME
jgi:transcription initiation factor TFIID TATA-box-binding protein